jgi:hypothetical protein
MPTFLEAISSSTKFIVVRIAGDLGPELYRVHKRSTKNRRAIPLTLQQLQIHPLGVG